MAHTDHADINVFKPTLTSMCLKDISMAHTDIKMCLPGIGKASLMFLEVSFSNIMGHAELKHLKLSSFKYTLNKETTLSFFYNC